MHRERGERKRGRGERKRGWGRETERERESKSTRERAHYEDGGRSWSDLRTGMPKIAGKHTKLGGMEPILRAPGRDQPHRHLNFRLPASGTVRE